MKWMSRLMMIVVMMQAIEVMAVTVENEQAIPLDKVPANVLEAARKAVPGIRMIAADVEKTPNGLVYDIEGTLDGKELEIEITADGKILEIEIEEQAIPLDEVPKQVLEAASNALPGIKLTEAEREKTNNGLVYEVEGTLDGKEYGFEIAADGKVLEIEMEGPAVEENKPGAGATGVPPAVGGTNAGAGIGR